MFTLFAGICFLLVYAFLTLRVADVVNAFIVVGACVTYGLVSFTYDNIGAVTLRTARS